MDLRGKPPRPSLVQDMANLLLASREINPPPTVGKDWVTNFVKRYPRTIGSRFSRRYDYRDAQREDPKVIREWFDSVQEVVAQYGIAADSRWAQLRPLKLPLEPSTTVNSQRYDQKTVNG